MEILLDSKRCPADTVCFHCQQFVDKFLKAVLTRHGIEAPKMHDIRRLIQLSEPFAPGLARFSDSSDTLTAHGVESRYPDDWCEIEPTEMNDVVELAKGLGEILLAMLDE